MKLNYFKFQDGKVFWLPEYPENRPVYPVGYDEDDECYSDYEDKLNTYDQAVAQSLASAIEVAPEDVNDFKLLWERTYRGVPMSGEVYSAECEMETKRYAKSKIIQNEMWFQVPAKSSNHWSKLTHEFRQVACLKHTPNP